MGAGGNTCSLATLAKVFPGHAHHFQCPIHLAPWGMGRWGAHRGAEGGAVAIVQTTRCSLPKLGRGVQMPVRCACSQPLQDLLREQACAGPPLELGLRELCALSVYTHVLRELPVLARQWLVALGAPPRDAIQHQRPHAYVCCPRCYPLLSSLSRASISYASQAVLGYRMPSPAQPSTQPQVTRRRLRRCPAEAPQVESCALVGRPRATQGSRALHIGHGHDLGIFAIIFKVPSGQVETEAVCCFS